MADITGLLERLSERSHNSPKHRGLLTATATTIETLQAENDRLREALGAIAAEDVEADIIDVLEPKERRMVDIAHQALTTVLHNQEKKA